MDEAIRIYEPVDVLGKHLRPEDIVEEVKQQEAEERKRFVMEEFPHYKELDPKKQPEPRKPWKKETYLESLQGVLEERRKKEADMNFRHPWFNLMYNWIVIIAVVALFASFWWWGARIRKDNREASIRATAYAEFQAEQEEAAEAERQAELAKKMSKENLMKENAKWKAKVLYGARNFEEKYGYTKADFLTLCQCIDNRCAYYGMTVEEVVRQEGQWVGYYDTNPGDIDKYYSIALESEKAKDEQETRPVGADYVYAYYTDRGIYLSNKYGDDRGFGMWRHE